MAALSAARTASLPKLSRENVFFCCLAWWPLLFFPTQNCFKKKVTDYLDTAALNFVLSVKSTKHTKFKKKNGQMLSPKLLAEYENFSDYSL